MSYVYKVTVSSEGTEDKVHFDTSTGSSDSFSDANRCFTDLCFKVLSPDTNSVIRLIENGETKKEMDHSSWAELRSAGKKKKSAPTSSKAASISTKETTGDAKSSKKDKKSDESAATVSVAKKVKATAKADEGAPSSSNKRKADKSESKPKEAAGKKKKDPNAPKSGKSAYMYFCDEQRPELKKTSPDLSFGDVGKKLGEMWKELDEESRAVWQDKAAEDKERFNKEMEDYVPPVQDDDDDEEEETSKKGKKAKKTKKEKDPNAPKRPMASYFLWMGENRDAIKAENPEATIGELGKIMGAKWKLLTDEEKEPFNVKAAEAKEKYNEDMKAYNAGKEGSSGGVKEKDVIGGEKDAATVDENNDEMSD